MRLLQGDRRANVEIIQANKDANKEEIKRLRDDNKELRVKIAQLQRAKDGLEGAGDGDADALRSGVIKMRKQFDHCKVTDSSYVLAAHGAPSWHLRPSEPTLLAGRLSLVPARTRPPRTPARTHAARISP